MKVGILGGTFNPIHTGHLLLAETAREALALTRVVFIPAGQPPHKAARSLLPGSVRLKLIQLAIRDHAAFASSDVELKRDGPSYTIETVRLLHARLPQATLVLIIGQDMLAVPWVAWKELKRLCTIVVARRPGARRARAARPGTPERAGETGLAWLQMPQVDIASSDIRRRVREGRSIRYLVPAAVERYIRNHRLYREGAG